MSAWRRHLFTVIAALLALLATSLIVAILSFNLDRYRPELEQGLSQALGVKVSVAGRLRFTLEPSLALTLGDVTAKHGDREVAAIKQLSIAFAPWSLLHRELLINDMTLEHARLHLSPGTWPFASASSDTNSTGIPSAIDLTWKLAQGSDYLLNHSSLSYADEQSPWHIVVDDFNLRLKAAELDPAQWDKGGVSTLSLRGTFRAERIRTKLASFEQPHMQVGFNARKLSLSDIGSRLFQGDGHGDFNLDWSTSPPVYRLNFKLQDFEAAESISRLAKQGLIHGPLSLYADLNWQGDTVQTMLGKLNGDVQLRGTGLQLKGIGLDKAIDTFEKSQHFNLVDLGAYFFIGPMGTVATKGYSFAKITSSNNEGPSRIEQLISDWHLENGIASAQDVALTTERNRIALRGRLDLQHGRYEGVEFAILNKQGCAILSQGITGPLQSPVIEPPKKLALLTAPVREAVDIPLKLLSKKNCTPFYTGALGHPGESQR